MSAKELITYPMLSNVKGLFPSSDSSMTVRDCPVSVRSVQEEVCDGTLVNVEEATRFVPDAAAAKAYCATSYVGPEVTKNSKRFDELTLPMDSSKFFEKENGLDRYRGEGDVKKYTRQLSTRC